MSTGGAAGLVVEFVGLPGAGKSALSHQVAVLLGTEGLTVSEPTRRLDGVGTASRSLAKAGYGIAGLVAAPLASARWMGTFVAMGQRSLADTGRVTLNWLFLSGLTRGLARRPGVHLLDQGVFQALWSAGYAARSGAVGGRELIEAVRDALPPRVFVVVVETSTETLRRRLHDRPGGDSRLERDLARGDSAEIMTRALAAFSSTLELVELLERQGAITVVRVQGETPGQLEVTAQGVAGRIVSAQSRSG